MQSNGHEKPFTNLEAWWSSLFWLNGSIPFRGINAPLGATPHRKFVWVLWSVGERGVVVDGFIIGSA